VHVRGVFVHRYGQLERFSEYALAAYQYLCSGLLDNTIVRSVSCARLTFVCLRSLTFRTLAAVLPCTYVCAILRMSSWCVTIGVARLLLRFGGVRSLRIWSLVSLVVLLCLFSFV
jgi:hypothetical protein